MSLCKFVRLQLIGGGVLSPRAPLALALLSRGLALLSRQEYLTQSPQLDPEGFGCAMTPPTPNTQVSA